MFLKSLSFPNSEILRAAFEILRIVTEFLFCGCCRFSAEMGVCNSRRGEKFCNVSSSPKNSIYSYVSRQNTQSGRNQCILHFPGDGKRLLTRDACGEVPAERPRWDTARDRVRGWRDHGGSGTEVLTEGF